MPPATGMPLRITTRTFGVVRVLADVRGEHPDRSPGQVRRPGRHRVGALTVHLDAGLVGDRDGDLVGQRQRLEDRDQVVVAVRAHVADRQVQVDLGRDADGDRGRNDGEHAMQPTGVRVTRAYPSL